ncbi:MOSC N-terminal beta barrel domain-containing protein [Amycolatopsis sp. NPDC059027]|uniref:MOSC N-terminal beta barrel domain-containing protein n=1 Tax=unclassified Amycolatopsis TaxID=2618356 RepID=UPI00366DC5AE
MGRGVVSALWRYPVKSMRGEWLRAAKFGERGVDGDRRTERRYAATTMPCTACCPAIWTGRR